MAVKKRQTGSANVRDVSAEDAARLADQLADKPYGEDISHQSKTRTAKKDNSSDDEIKRTSISLPKSLLESVEDLAQSNKRRSVDPKSVSAIIKSALDLYMKKHAK